MAENKPLTVLQRLDNHQSALEVVKQNVDDLFHSFRNSTQTTMELLEAVVIHLGEGTEEKIKEIIKSKRLERALARAEQEKQQVEQLLKGGVLKVAEVVGEKSLMIGRVFDKDDSVVGAGRTQLEFPLLPDELKKAFLGQGVGFVYTAPSGIEKLELLEVYDRVEAAVAQAVAKVEEVAKEVAADVVPAAMSSETPTTVVDTLPTPATTSTVTSN